MGKKRANQEDTREEKDDWKKETKKGKRLKKRLKTISLGKGRGAPQRRTQVKSESEKF